jgi:hypothetical protein
MIHLDSVIMLEEQPAVATAPVLRFEQLGKTRAGVRMPSLSRTPVDPIAIIGATVRSDLNVPRDRHPTMGQEVHGVRISGRGGEGHPVIPLMPVSFPHPARGFCWVSTVCPAAELFPGEKVEPFEDCLTHTGAVVVRPSTNFRVELLDQGALGKACERRMIRPSSAKCAAMLALAGLIRVLNPRRLPLECFPDWCFPTRY